MVNVRASARPLGILVGLLLLGAAAAIAWNGTDESIQTLGEGELGSTGEILAIVGLAMTMLSTARFSVTVWLSLLDQYLNRSTASAPSAEQPFVSIIVPVFNEGPMIRASLGSLLEQDYPNYEIVVVDDGSSDDTFDRAYWLARSTPRRRLRILTQPNGGKSSALNHGIAASEGSLLLCVDGDTVLERQALSHAVRRMNSPQIGAVAGCVRVINRKSLWARFQALEYVCGLALLKRAQSAASSVVIVPGPFGLFRRSALASVGGYERHLFAEDFDLTLKLLGAGWHVVYEPKARALTEAPEQMLDLIQQRYRWSRGSIQALMRRRHLLASPISAPVRCLALWYLMLDCIGWPLFNVLGLITMVTGIALAELQGAGAPGYLVLWWLQCMLLDCAIAAYCVITEDEDAGLLWVAPASRVFFSYFLDVWRLLAAAEEFTGVKMTWGSIRRLGRLG